MEHLELELVLAVQMAARTVDPGNLEKVNGQNTVD